MIEVSVITRVGPGRLWELDLWEQSLGLLGLPEDRTRIVVGDNSCDDATRRRIADILCGGPWGEWAILADRTYNRPKLEERPEEHSYHQAKLFSRLVRASMLSPYILSLDSDVLVPGADELGGSCAYPMLKSRMADDVAVVGTPACSRWSGDVSVYRVDTIEPWGKLRRVEPRGRGVVEEVHAFGTCLTLWRGDLFRKYELKGEPNVHGKPRLGLEWWTYKMFLRDGFRMLCDWSIRPKHYKNRREYVQA